MNFGGDEVVYDYDKSKIIIVPVPYDGTSTWMKGADRGPQALLESSVNMEFYDAETNSEVHKAGIYTMSPVSENSTPEAMVAAVRERAALLYKDNRFPVVIGGEHSVSIGAIEAAASHYPGVTILQLDAHSDLRDEYENSRYNHACVMARAKEVAPVVQVGIRSISAGEVQNADMSRIFFAHDLYNDRSLYKKVLEKLGKKVYITIDLDVFDSSLMPSTGTPEPGGLTYREVTGFLREVMIQSEVVGFDIVELCPSPYNRAPDFMAARLLYQLLSYRFGIDYNVG